MARMAFTATRASKSPPPTGAELALVPIDDGAEEEAWSIDREAIGSSWHDSSWLLRRGLQVDENPPPEAIPPEWQWRWWIASRAAA